MTWKTIENFPTQKSEVLDFQHLAFENVRFFRYSTFLRLLFRRFLRRTATALRRLFGFIYLSGIRLSDFQQERFVPGLIF